MRFKDIGDGRDIFGQVDIHPHLNFPLLIEADLIFLDIKRVGVEKDVIKSFEAGLEQVEVVGEGDVSDLAQPQWNMLNVEAIFVAVSFADEGSAEAFNVLHIHQVFALISPLNLGEVVIDVGDVCSLEDIFVDKKGMSGG